MPWVKMSGDIGFKERMMVRNMKGLWEMMGFQFGLSFFSTYGVLLE